MKNIFTSVEQSFAGDVAKRFETNIPYITVDNFPMLGKLAAMRFLEWVADNPTGVISLPTGKTPEYFIEWVRRILTQWDDSECRQMRERHGLMLKDKPVLSELQFVQIDEFYPISPKQHTSFYNYVQKYYVEGFGLDASKGLFINSDEIVLADGRHYSDVFSDGDRLRSALS